MSIVYCGFPLLHASYSLATRWSLLLLLTGSTILWSESKLLLNQNTDSRSRMWWETGSGWMCWTLRSRPLRKPPQSLCCLLPRFAHWIKTQLFINTVKWWGTASFGLKTHFESRARHWGWSREMSVSWKDGMTSQPFHIPINRRLKGWQQAHDTATQMSNELGCARIQQQIEHLHLLKDLLWDRIHHQLRLA